MSFIHINVPQGSEEWLVARSGVITASTFADRLSRVNELTEQQAKYVTALRAGKGEAEAMAIAQYKAKPKFSALERALAGLPCGEPSEVATKLAIQTAIEQISGKPYGDQGGNFFATERGHEGEAFARMRYEARNMVIVDEAGLFLTEDRIFGASVDGCVGDDGLIEVKVPLDPRKVVDIIRTGDISEYMPQIFGQLWITGRKWCDFLMGIPDLAALNNGNELYVKRVYRDEAFIEKMETELWQHALRVKEYRALLSAPFNAAANDAASDLRVAA